MYLWLTMILCFSPLVYSFNADSQSISSSKCSFTAIFTLILIFPSHMHGFAMLIYTAELLVTALHSPNLLSSSPFHLFICSYFSSHSLNLEYWVRVIRFYGLVGRWHGLGIIFFYEAWTFTHLLICLYLLCFHVVSFSFLPVSWVIYCNQQWTEFSIFMTLYTFSPTYSIVPSMKLS